MNEYSLFFIFYIYYNIFFIKNQKKNFKNKKEGMIIPSLRFYAVGASAGVAGVPGALPAGANPFIRK